MVGALIWSAFSQPMSALKQEVYKMVQIILRAKPSPFFPHIMDISLGHTVVAGIVLTVAISLVARWMTLRANPRGLPFPPGPAGKLFVGNLGHVPEATNPDSWREFRKLAKSYGMSYSCCMYSPYAQDNVQVTWSTFVGLETPFSTSTHTRLPMIC